jgi:hypothetical protein
LTNKNHPDSQIARSSQRSIDLSVRRAVATHRVENDFSRQPRFILRLISHRRSFLIRLSLFYPHHLPVLVVSTLRTDAVLQPGLLAIGTEGCLRRAQSIVRAAFAAASF